MRQSTQKHHQTMEKVNSLRYLVTKFDEKGWAKAKKALPVPFDLVTVLTDTDKCIAAWWNITHWQGLRLRKNDTVIKWKRRLYEHLSS